MDKQKTINDIAFSLLYRNRTAKGHQVLAHYGSAQEAFKHIDEPSVEACFRQAEKEWQFASIHNIQCSAPDDDTYPLRLKQCPDAPLMLYTKGNVQPNTGKFVSVVGTRACTERGKDLTRRFVLDLARQVPDITIVSGLAYGIDIAAHRAALEANIPTLIVVGHGMDRIYPAVHRQEAIRSLDKGGILTEYTSGTDPDRYNFVARDRIIAGLADAVVVVESKDRGGSLITAQMALDYSRNLFAFPGRVQDETSSGCNLLIRDQKAALITSANDLVRAMMWQANTEPVQTEIATLLEGMTDEESQIINLLQQNEDGVHVNNILAEMSLNYSQLISTLTMMEMKGWVKSMPGGVYRLCS
ncbi:MAG: DNA-processing protein DprA [Paludibacteraceae bacterium]|nr:DNA-processing protein DprA [Paludibacteraceae bacterium]